MPDCRQELVIYGCKRNATRKSSGVVLRSVATGQKPVAKMLRRHLDGMLKWYECYIDNAMTEGFNSAVQAIKACARGFRNFENYRLAILFSYGRLAMYPEV